MLFGQVNVDIARPFGTRFHIVVSAFALAGNSNLALLAIMHRCNNHIGKRGRIELPAERGTAAHGNLFAIGARVRVLGAIRIQLVGHLLRPQLNGFLVQRNVAIVVVDNPVKQVTAIDFQRRITAERQRHLHMRKRVDLVCSTFQAVIGGEDRRRNKVALGKFKTRVDKTQRSINIGKNLFFIELRARLFRSNHNSIGRLIVSKMSVHGIGCGFVAGSKGFIQKLGHCLLIVRNGERCAFACMGEQFNRPRPRIHIRQHILIRVKTIGNLLAGNR